MQQDKTIKKIEKARKKLGSDASHRQIAREAGVSRPAVKKYFEEQAMPGQPGEIEPESYEYLKERLGMPDWMIHQYWKLLKEDPKAALKLIQGSPEIKNKENVMSDAVRDMILADATIKSGYWQGSGNPPEWLKPCLKEQSKYEDTSTASHKFCP